PVTQSRPQDSAKTVVRTRNNVYPLRGGPVALITSSARVTSACRIIRPDAFAVLPSITSSNWSVLGHVGPHIAQTNRNDLPSKSTATIILCCPASRTYLKCHRQLEPIGGTVLIGVA